MEGKQPTIEELLNTIELMKLALEFYAKDETYIRSNGRSSSIDMDLGNQAKFALKQVKKISDYNKMLVDNYDEMIKTMNGEDDLELINKLNNISEIIKKYGD